MGGDKNNLAFYRLSTDQSLDELRTAKSGLDTKEASTRLEQHGPNLLKHLSKESAVRKYLRQFRDLMVVMLLASSIISAVLGDGRTAIALLALVLFNTIIGFSQEYKAEKLMDSLDKLVVADAKVVRNGKLDQIPSVELVPGDIVYIEAGDSIPADLRLIDESELETNDFALTGESNPSRKFIHAISSSVELANRHNLVFMGTTVATGHGHGVVIATGMQTELGRIASLSADTATDLSPLQKEMKNLATRVTQGTVLLCVILLPVAIKSGLPFKDSLLVAIGFASSLIPNGLPAAINTSLARAANKLARARVLVKKLSAVETLGATAIICTDKTGTLTKNQMTVQQLIIGRDTYSVSGIGYESTGSIEHNRKSLSADKLADIELFFATGAMASNASINPPDEDHAEWYCLGDPTEGSLITLARKAGVEPNELNETYPEIREFAFDSARKRMSSIRKYGPHGQYYVFVKGALENVLDRSNEIWDHGHIRGLKVSDHEFFLAKNTTLAEEAMRNLGYAFKILPANTDIKKLKMEDVESGLTFLGMVSMVDPLREEVPAAMAAAHQAHINMSIITGDFAVTAKAIARKAGLARPGQEIKVVSGEELRQLDDTQVLHLATRGGVIFSRVSPEDKLRIVNLIKNNDHVVAVTGDGINDAPALKRADIGVAMGITGTDVAKESAEIILLDDSFSTLIRAVQQGRVIFQNIKKSTLSALTSNAAELSVSILSFGAAILFKVPLALSVMLILAIDLIAELFPIAALGWDEAENDIMHEPPRKSHEHILTLTSGLNLLWAGFLAGSLAFGNYLLFFYRNGVSPQYIPSASPLHLKAMALTYLTMVLCLFVNTLQTRSTKGLFTRYQLHNKALGIAFAASIFCVLNIIYNPVLNTFFGTGPLTINDWLCALAATLIFLTVREVQRHANTHHTRDQIISLLQEKTS